MGACILDDPGYVQEQIFWYLVKRMKLKWTRDIARLSTVSRVLGVWGLNAGQARVEACGEAVGVLTFWPRLPPCITAGFLRKRPQAAFNKDLLGRQHSSLPSTGNSHLDNFPPESQASAPPISFPQREVWVSNSVFPHMEKPPQTCALHGSLRISVMRAWGQQRGGAGNTRQCKVCTLPQSTILSTWEFTTIRGKELRMFI